MKKLILQNVVWSFISILLFSSCIDEGRKVDTGYVFGVVRTDYMKGLNLLDVAEDVSFYSSRFEYDYDGDCFFVYYEIDHELPGNSFESVEKNGFYEVTIGTEKQKVDKWNVSVLLPADTLTSLPDELPIKAALDGDIIYIKGKMFLISNLQKATYQKINWTLKYDIDNMLTEERGQRYYNLFLRATEGQGTNSNEFISFANAFEIKYFLRDVVQKEKELGGESFYIRFNFPSIISEDGKMTWEYQNTRGSINVKELVLD